MRLTHALTSGRPCPPLPPHTHTHTHTHLPAARRGGPRDAFARRQGARGVGLRLPAGAGIRRGGIHVRGQVGGDHEALLQVRARATRCGGRLGHRVVRVPPSRCGRTQLFPFLFFSIFGGKALVWGARAGRKGWRRRARPRARAPSRSLGAAGTMRRQSDICGSRAGALAQGMRDVGAPRSTGARARACACWASRLLEISACGHAHVPRD